MCTVNHMLASFFVIYIAFCTVRFGNMPPRKYRAVCATPATFPSTVRCGLGHVFVWMADIPRAWNALTWAVAEGMGTDAAQIMNTVKRVQ